MEMMRTNRSSSARVISLRTWVDIPWMSIKHGIFSMHSFTLISLKLYYYYWLGGFESDNSSRTCYRTTVKTSSAVSPAFIIDGKQAQCRTWKLKVYYSLLFRLQLEEYGILHLDRIMMGIVFCSHISESVSSSRDIRVRRWSYSTTFIVYHHVLVGDQVGSSLRFPVCEHF